jgi:hypothetical protein
MIWLYIELVLFALLLVCAPYMLWADYLSVMALKRQRDAQDTPDVKGGLSTWAAIAGPWILIRGYTLDFLVNITWMTAILWELPRELTVTHRLRRHIEGNTKHAALCLSIRTKLLDGFDPAGIHR